jgi:hypothetical protein
MTKTKTKGEEHHFPVKKTQKRNHLLHSRSNLQRTRKAQTSDDVICGTFRQPHKRKKNRP